MKRALPALVFLALARPASADILFLDLNVSDREVAAAHEAAEARHEKLIVIPDIPQAARTRFGAINQKIIPLEKQQDTLVAEYQKNPSRGEEIHKELTKISEQLTPLAREQSELAHKYPFGWKAVNQAVAEIEKKKGVVTSIIVSGHSNGYTIWGADTVDQDVVHPSDLSRLSAKFPKAMTGLRSLLLWGCYAGTLGSAKTWKSELPQLKLTAGFFGSGPSGLSAASANLLGDVLRKDEQITRKEQMKELNAMFRGLKSVTTTNAAMLVNHCYFSVKDGAMRADESAAGKCPDAKDHYLTTLYAEYANYERADTPMFSNPPPDPHHSPLRDFYSLVQKYSQCPFIQSLPLREKILSLIFFDSVKRNFAEYYKKEIGDYNATLHQIWQDRAKDTAIPDLSSPKTTRAQIKAASRLYESAQSSIFQKLKELGKDPSKESKKLQGVYTDALGKLRLVGDPLLKLLDHLDCVPMTWITTPPTPGVKPDKPSC